MKVKEYIDEFYEGRIFKFENGTEIHMVESIDYDSLGDDDGDKYEFQVYRNDEFYGWILPLDHYSNYVQDFLEGTEPIEAGYFETEMEFIKAE